MGSSTPSTTRPRPYFHLSGPTTPTWRIPTAPNACVRSPHLPSPVSYMTTLRHPSSAPYHPSAIPPAPTSTKFSVVHPLEHAAGAQYISAPPEYSSTAPQYTATAPQYTATDPQYTSTAPQYTSPPSAYANRDTRGMVPASNIEPDEMQRPGISGGASDEALQWWYERLNSLEAQVQSAGRDVNKKEAERTALAKQWKEEREWNESLTRHLHQERRVKTLLEAEKKQVADNLSSEQEKVNRISKDKKCLIRTIEKLRRAVEKAESDRKEAEIKMDQLAESETKLQDQMKKMSEEMEKLKAEAEAYPVEIQNEREKRQTLKSEVKDRIEKLVELNSMYQTKIVQSEETIAELQAQCERWRNQATEAESKVEEHASKFREKLEASETRVVDEELNNADVQRQNRELQLANEQLHHDLAQCRDQLFAVESRWKQQQQEWRLSHITRVDRSLMQRERLTACECPNPASVDKLVPNAVTSPLKQLRRPEVGWIDPYSPLKPLAKVEDRESQRDSPKRRTFSCAKSTLSRPQRRRSPPKHQSSGDGIWMTPPDPLL